MLEEQSNNTPSIYSRVIFKNQNDKEAEDMVNSYRYRTSSPGKFKKWTPEFSYEERYKKKRNREDKYISQIEDQDRPVLVIQKKHEYQGLKNPKIFSDNPQIESYYKVSENTQLVDDLSEEITKMENFIKRHTFIHKPKNVDQKEEGLSTVYKIEGQEFLPEGFIELDPLLLKDEYQFESKQDEKLFDKEQRKMKNLRRKQYEQRNNKKLRDVTIYVMDEKKSNVIQFLEKWYEKHKRKINKAEIEYVSKILNVDPDQLDYFQDLYLKMKNIHQSQGISEDGFKNFPKKLQGNNAYDDITPKYMDNTTPYVPTFLNKYEKKSQRLPRYNIKKKPNNSPLLNTKELDKTLVKTLGNSKELNQDRNNIQNNYQEEPVKNLKLAESQQKFENNLEQYFDQEINTILDKIKGSKEHPKNSGQDYVQQYKKKISQNDSNLKDLANVKNQDQSFEVPLEKEVQISSNPEKQRMKSQSMMNFIPGKTPKRFSWMGMGKERNFYFQKLKPILIENEYFYQTIEGEINPKNQKKQEILYTKDDKGNVISDYQIPEEKQSDKYESFIHEKPESFLGDKGKLVVVKNGKDEEIFSQILRPTKPQIFQENFEDEIENKNFRKSNINILENIKTHQLPPNEFDGKDYKVQVEELNFPEQNFEQINVVVYDDQNNIISNKTADPNLKGTSYYSTIEEGDENSFFLNTNNNHGDVLNSLELGKLNQDVENQVIEDDQNQTKIIKLNPLAIGDRFIRQEIILTPEDATVITYNDLDEVMDETEADKSLVTDQCNSLCDNDQDQIIVKLQNENGDIISDFYVPKEYASFQNKQFDDLLTINDDKGEPRASIAVKQKDSKILRSYSIRPTLIGDKFYNQTINEIIDDDNYDNNKAVLITQDEEGNTIDVQEVDPKMISNDYYNQIIDQTIDNMGNKTSEVITFNDQKEVLGTTRITTTLPSKYADEYLDQIVEEIINEDQGEEKAEILAMQKIEDGSYEIIQDEIQLPQKKDKSYYENLFNNMDKNQPRRSFDNNQRDRSGTHHGMPQNYKFINTNQIGQDQKLDDGVRDYINQALEDVNLISKVDENQEQEIKDSLRKITNQEPQQMVTSWQNNNMNFDQDDLVQSVQRGNNIPQEDNFNHQKKNNISPYQQRQSDLKTEKRNHMTPEEQRQSNLQSKKKQHMTPEEQRQSNLQSKKKQHMTPEEQRQSNLQSKKKQNMTPEEQRQSNLQSKKKQNMTPEEQRQSNLKNQKKKLNISPNQQQSYSYGKNSNKNSKKSLKKKPSMKEENKEQNQTISEYQNDNVFLYDSNKNQSNQQDNDNNSHEDHQHEHDHPHNHDHHNHDHPDHNHDDRRKSRSHSQHSRHSRNSVHSQTCMHEHGSYLKQFLNQSNIDEHSMDDFEHIAQRRKSSIYHKEAAEDFFNKDSINQRPQFKTTQARGKSPSLIEQIYGNILKNNQLNVENDNQSEDFHSFQDDENQNDQQNDSQYNEENNNNDSQQIQDQNINDSQQIEDQNINDQQENSQDLHNDSQQNEEDQNQKRRSQMSNFQSFDQNNQNNEIQNEQQLGNVDEQQQDDTDEQEDSKQEDNDDLRNQLKNVLKQEEQKMNPNFMNKLSKKTGMTQDELLDDFYKFCKNLQQSSKYKESVLFATLFYYYVERKKKNKKQYILEEDVLIEMKKLLPYFDDEFQLQEEIKNSSQVIDRLLLLEKAVRQYSFFSPNESYVEILEENLILINLPYYIGLCCEKIIHKRLEYIQKGADYYKIFLNLLMHYQILQKPVEQIFQLYLEKENFQVQREQKIELYRLEKVQIEEIEKSKENQRKYQQAQTQLKSIKCLNKLFMIPQEIQLLKFREELEKDPEKKQQFEKENKEYIPPKIKFFKIDEKSRKPNEIIQQYLFDRGIEVPDELKPKNDITMNPNLSNKIVESYIPPSSKLNQRDIMQKEMFKASWTQPKMTLDEHTDLEYTLMIDKQNQQKSMAKARKIQLEEMGIPDEEDSDNELVADIKTYKAREWDKFTDVTDKGDGNRGGNQQIQKILF